MRWLTVLLGWGLLVGCGRPTSPPPTSTPAPEGETLAPRSVAEDELDRRAFAAPRVSARFAAATAARLEDKYVTVVFADGSKSMLPQSTLLPTDRAWLADLAKRSPFTGRGRVVVADTVQIRPKHTIEVATLNQGSETVQLCAPSKFLDQIGGTCMIYARVHWLDIAGYPVDAATIYRIINGVPPDRPWRDPQYLAGLRTIMTGFPHPPVAHRLPAGSDPFAWARAELRRGRPVLAAFPREIWQALPPGFVATHPWNGGSVGHQIVINGFRWSEASGEGSFHIVNSWAELPEFDLTLAAAGGGALLIERSLSPLGEVQPEAVEERVLGVTLVRELGATRLYRVETNLDDYEVVAATPAAARRMLEQNP